MPPLAAGLWLHLNFVPKPASRSDWISRRVFSWHLPLPLRTSPGTLDTTPNPNPLLMICSRIWEHLFEDMRRQATKGWHVGSCIAFCCDSEASLSLLLKPKRQGSHFSLPFAQGEFHPFFRSRFCTTAADS